MKFTAISVFVLHLLVDYGLSNDETVKVEICPDPDAVFSVEDITGLKIHHLKSTQLKQDFFKKLTNLESIEISSTGLSTFEPHAFRDMQNLKSVKMKFNYKLKMIPKGVFNLIGSVQTLDLSGNHIDFIESYAFAKLPSLITFKASFNALKYWMPDWFDNSTNIEELYFNSNKIISIPPRALAAMPKLRKIDFASNEITTIGYEAFGELTRLEVLDLGWNKLIVIDDDVFRHSISIMFLNIQINKLNFLPTKLLKKVSVHSVNLDMNPWKCSCLISRIYEWVRSSNGTLINYFGSYDSPVCGIPIENSHKCLENEQVDNELTSRFLRLCKPCVYKVRS